MSNKPQISFEEIELIPHPLEAWRMALNALIAVAPGTAVDIAWHLKDAREKTLVCRSFSATQGEVKLIDRLMLIGAGKLVGQRLDQQRAAGVIHPADHIASSSRRVHLHPTLHPSSGPAATPATGPAEQRRPVQQLRPGEAMPETGHSPAPSDFLPDRS
ncbi:hypothetical protein [Pseudomonas alcaligenes]|uniref:hypothetical protein n=1 Tax=Aquipseudomonas alcaligenes TaxID=43263 RepID=UPI0035900B85